MSGLTTSEISLNGQTLRDTPLHFHDHETLSQYFLEVMLATCNFSSLKVTSFPSTETKKNTNTSSWISTEADIIPQEEH